jgi:lysyl-tRNA synthetase class 2
MAKVPEDRKQKLDALREGGINPYANRCPGTRFIRGSLEAIERDETPPAHVAGRILAVRHHGKSAFLRLKDSTGEIQVYLQKDRLGADEFEIYKLLDLGDFVAVEGECGRTRTGEATIFADRFQVLTKSLLPPPEKWHGLRDVELRYRHRYVDLFSNDDVVKVFRLRSRVVSEIRGFLAGRDFLEVETPMMHPIAGGAAARPFITHHNTLDMDLFMRVAPELYLKRLLVGGLDRVYEVNRSFRNEGISPRHNPEYTMLEAYQAYADYSDMMELTESLLVQVIRATRGEETETLEYQGRTISVRAPFARRPYGELLREKGGIGLEATPDEVRARAGALGIETKGVEHWKLLNEVFEKTVEPTLVDPTFVTDYPVPICPLSKAKEDDPTVAERFELFVAGMELVNAFSELNDPLDQEERFRRQVDSRDEEAPAEVDQDYVTALLYGMPPAGGMGLGVDRLIMLLSDSASIRDVILFPLLRRSPAETEPVKS